MDRIVFHHDTVLSDIHLLLPNTRHLMARLNRVGQPVFTTKFKILWRGEAADTWERGSASEKEEDDVGSVPEEEEEKEEEDEAGASGEADEEEAEDEPDLDDDGDLKVSRRPKAGPSEGHRRAEVYPVILRQSSAAPEDAGDEEGEDGDQPDVIRIEHTMATSLQDVGKQVWRGAFLLADYIYSHASVFRNATVLELGAGTGLTSIIMATAAKRVYSTDVGEDLLSMCQRNATLNKHLLAAEGELKVRQLDWLKDDLCTEEEEEFSWTEEEVADLYDNTSVIIAADVCYDDDLTDGFFRTVYRLCNSMTKPCTIYLSLEKRMNFTLRHMDVSCDAYDYFSHCLRQLEALGDGPRRFTVEPLATSFPQCLQYERIEHLELWKVTSTPTGGRQRGGEDPPAPTPLPRPDPGPGPGPGPGPDPGPDPDPDP
ncbi:methyltransferase-like protein 22 [Gadus morhua]|uniref:Methyltransferase-like protein 22 n=1 Tax=Gadus morhua TaxID=8049 RepID=A0A8C4ZXP7_GADMO|nr:methyltransferase-like protein 22 [Gadus morhua]XP_030200492.1 methyltransferase-like protein 22 [Gadus morhua]XP_030200501.1 methyltransferase-like protein 22 [Gadus morhua]XP_030200510.1 methyltransferase-like protein 22 [Gadus morhua]XP_030200519.1 methyltransferase-like protein 22 [Gadus morhua]XP_030200528.1 methyltransferase-like protein 22 [Gadus morhua]XP_030200537.1 methyltransferase-like protein 22 [Gadus morhua]